MIKFTIPGKAVSKERPRKGKYGWYTPSKTLAFEEQVHYNALKAGLKPIDDESIGIGICFYGNYGKNDIDNLQKSVLDGLKHFFNDNKVTFLVGKKIPSPEYRTEVKIF